MERSKLGILGLARRAGKVILGYDSILKSTRVCKILIVASDISERTKKNIYNLNINVMESGLTKSELGRLLGAGEVAVLAVTDENFLKALTD